MPLGIGIFLLVLGGVSILLLTIFIVRQRREAHEIGPVRDSRGLRKTKPFFQRDVVERKVRSLFPNIASQDILALLDTVTPSPFGLERLQLALLKLSDGNLDELRKLVAIVTSKGGLEKGADIQLIGTAETPEAQRMGDEYLNLLPKKQEPIFQRDLHQYLRWVKQ
jgi:hypothetical protein